MFPVYTSYFMKLTGRSLSPDLLFVGALALVSFWMLVFSAQAFSQDFRKGGYGPLTHKLC